MNKINKLFKLTILTIISLFAIMLIVKTNDTGANSISTKKQDKISIIDNADNNLTDDIQTKLKSGNYKELSKVKKKGRTYKRYKSTNGSIIQTLDISEKEREKLSKQNISLKEKNVDFDDLVILDYEEIILEKDLSVSEVLFNKITGTNTIKAAEKLLKQITGMQEVTKFIDTHLE